MCKQVICLLICLHYTPCISTLYRNVIIKRLNSACKLTKKSDSIDQPMLCVIVIVKHIRCRFEFLFLVNLLKQCLRHENPPVNKPRSNKSRTQFSLVNLLRQCLFHHHIPVCKPRIN